MELTEIEKKIDIIFKNVVQVLKLLDLINIDPQRDISNINDYNYICVKLVYNFLSHFKYKICDTPNEELLHFINECLQLINSKFIISVNHPLSKLEFVNFILFFIVEYDYIHDFIDHLNILSRKHSTINIKNLISVSLNKNTDTNDQKNEKMTDKSNFLEFFNRLKFSLGNLKKQVDSFINLTYKLNELKKTQETPIKYEN